MACIFIYIFLRFIGFGYYSAQELGALIKLKQHDHLGVAPLKEGSIIYCDPIQKANILNRQFISVFTDDTKT